MSLKIIHLTNVHKPLGQSPYTEVAIVISPNKDNLPVLGVTKFSDPLGENVTWPRIILQKKTCLGIMPWAFNVTEINELFVTKISV